MVIKGDMGMASSFHLFIKEIPKEFPRWLGIQKCKEIPSALAEQVSLILLPVNWQDFSSERNKKLNSSESSSVHTFNLYI